jgi:two-component system CheB/CheR fusion protein
VDGHSSKESGTHSRPSAEEGGFVAALAHDINSPLDSLFNLLFLLGDEPGLSESGRSHLRLAQDEAQRISQIARSAVRQFQVDACPESTNVTEMLRSVVEFYRSRFTAQGISVHERYRGNGDLRVYAGALRRTFANLLVNAADSMPAGGEMYTRIAIAHEWAGRRRLGVRVTIADNGCGIAEEVLLEIWRPFFTTKGSAGTGLGLPLVCDTVQKHDGVLRLRSVTRAGRSGSVFTIFLPNN